MKVKILEDEFFAARHLADLVEELGYTVCGTYHSAEEFLENLQEPFDMAILDIQLTGKLTGIDVAHQLHVADIPFIYLTANNEKNILQEAVKYAPRAYISKPFNRLDIDAALTMVDSEQEKDIKFISKDGSRYISPRSIRWVKSDGVYIEVATDDGVMVQRKLLKEIAEELPSYFIRTHRSYLVNSKRISSVSSNVVMVGEEKIPVSRSYRTNLEQR